MYVGLMRSPTVEVSCKGYKRVRMPEDGASEVVFDKAGEDWGFVAGYGFFENEESGRPVKVYRFAHGFTRNVKKDDVMLLQDLQYFERRL